MLKKLFTSIAILFICLSAQTASAKIDAYDVYGKPHNFTLTKGQWIIINYWADWCHACIEEIPDLNKLADLVKNKNVLMFGINYDSLPDDNQQHFAEQFRISYMLLRNNPFKDSMPHNQITSLPVTYIISPTGQVQELNGEIRISDVLNIIG
jgi:thiol-disulfide isomerase/thioredoxin